MATSTADAERDITTIVRERYGAIARAGSGCCGSAEDQSRRIGYTAEDLSTVPAGANLGVGCGAPLKHVALRAGAEFHHGGDQRGCWISGQEPVSTPSLRRARFERPDA